MPFHKPLPAKRATSPSLPTVAAIAAASTVAARTASAFFDVAFSAGKVLAHSVRPVQSPLPIAARSSSPLLSPLHKLPFQLLKSVPTKTLTAVFLDLALHSLASSASTDKPAVALTAGSTALLLTYPLHFFYSAWRSRAPLASITRAAARRPLILYAGFAPALAASLPVMLADYAIYKRVRHSYSVANRTDGVDVRSLGFSLAVVGVLSKVVGKAGGLPLTQLARQAATAAVKAGGAASPSATALGAAALQKGASELWRGLPRKSLSTSVAALVGKHAQSSLKRMGSRKMALPVVDGECARTDDKAECV